MKTVTILSDGRPGHFNQTLGIAERLKQVEVKIIEVHYKRKFFDLLLRLSGFIYRFVPFSKPFIEFLFKISLENKTFEEIISTNPDIVMSAGSSVATINAMLGKLKDAKSIVCMTPSFIGTAPFDLAVVPEHDLLPDKENIIKTIGAPNRINKAFIEKEIEKWNDMLDIDLLSLNRPLVSIFLGGSDQYHTMNMKIVATLLKEIENFVLKKNGQLLITTSLRTPGEVENKLKNRFPNNICPLLIIADEWDDNPVPMMIGISDIIIVTEDSVSMISEAVSGNNKVVVVGLAKNKSKRKPRYLQVCNLLKEKGYISYIEHGQVGTGKVQEVMADLYNAEKTRHLLDDTSKVAREIQERFL